VTRRVNGSSEKARKNSNGRDLFLSFTIIRNNCLERWKKREIEIETEIEREKESGRLHRAISRLLRRETTGRDVANREIVSCTGTHSPVHASSTCVQVTRVYCHGGVQ